MTQWAVALLPLLGLIASSGVHAISKVSRSGRYLYTDDGNRFYIKGVAYQEQGTGLSNDGFNEPSTFVDPLADSDGCARDLPLLQKLGVNAIRVYSVDSSKNHDSCMSALSGAGIYTIIDLSLPLNGSIDRASPSWTTNLLSQYTNTIDVFSKYDNVLAYNVGNEVVRFINETTIAPYIKAAARDVKSYLKSKSISALVGYASIDGDDTFKDPLANYYSCDPSGKNDDSTAIDLFGLNDYSWCGDSTFESSYASVEAQFAGYNVAAYFSEYGCVKTPPRPWSEVGALFSSQMSDVWSGGIAFSYFPRDGPTGPEGMITLSSDNKTVSTSDDFDNLVSQYSKASPPNTPSKNDAGSSSYPSCPSTNSSFLASSTLPPTPNTAACSCLENALSCKFTPKTATFNTIVGPLLDTACQLLGQKGLNCDDISGNGSKGVYGHVSPCDPTIKLSYVMSKYYEANNRDVQACDFAGNGTVNSAASTSSADAVASSCISNPDAIFTPSSAPTKPGGSQSSSGTGGGSKNNGAEVLMAGLIPGLSAVVVAMLGSAAWILM